MLTHLPTRSRRHSHAVNRRNVRSKPGSPCASAAPVGHRLRSSVEIGQGVKRFAGISVDRKSDRSCNPHRARSGSPSRRSSPRSVGEGTSYGIAVAKVGHGVNVRQEGERHVSLEGDYGYSDGPGNEAIRAA
jgi:hypothetical protein